MEMKYIHLRAYNPNLLPKGGATIAYSTMPARDEWQKEVVKVMFTMAKCAPRDHFCKKLGRIIANGRADKGVISVIELPAGLPRYELRKILVENYYRDEERFFPDVRKHVK